MAWLSAADAVEEACDPSLTTLLVEGAEGAAEPWLPEDPEPCEEPVPCWDEDPPADDAPPCDVSPDDGAACDDDAALCDAEPDESDAEPLPDVPAPDADESLDELETVDASLTLDPFADAELSAVCADGSAPLADVLEVVESLVVLLLDETRSAATGCEAGSVDALLD